MSDANNPVLLITGASSGIGAETARAAAREGYRLMLAARSEDKLKALQQELGGDERVAITACDVQSVDDQKAMVDKALDRFGRIDAVFANASLFHVPSQELPRILSELHDCLRAGGILFSSNPRGNDEGWSGDRYGNYMELEEASSCLETAGFNVLSHYYRPEGMPRAQQPWLAIVCKRQ